MALASLNRVFEKWKKVNLKYYRFIEPSQKSRAVLNWFYFGDIMCQQYDISVQMMKRINADDANTMYTARLQISCFRYNAGETVRLSPSVHDALLSYIRSRESIFVSKLNWSFISDLMVLNFGIHEHPVIVNNNKIVNNMIVTIGHAND